MIFRPPTEIALIGVADPGVANRERVVLRPMQSVDMSSYGMFVGLRLPDGSAVPLRDNFFWFGRTNVDVPSWIVLYTGSGEPRTTNDSQGHPVYEFYWGRATTVFNANDIVPVLFQIGSIAVATNVNAPTQPPYLAALLGNAPSASESARSIGDLLKLGNAPTASTAPTSTATTTRSTLADLLRIGNPRGPQPNASGAMDALLKVKEASKK